MVKMLDGACVDGEIFVELLYVVGNSSTDEVELTALGTTNDEVALIVAGGAGTLIGVEELCGTGRNTDVDESCSTDVLGSGLLVEAVDLARVAD